jgi:hypothetical protein
VRLLEGDAMDGPEHDHAGPPPASEYRILWRSPDAPAGLDGWEEASYWPRDLHDAEATAERWWREHHERWPDRRDFAVMEVARRPVKVWPAPAREEGGGA